MSQYFIAFVAASLALVCLVALLDSMATGQLRQFRQEALQSDSAPETLPPSVPVRQD
jgi:hypothetical protein